MSSLNEVHAQIDRDTQTHTLLKAVLDELRAIHIQVETSAIAAVEASNAATAIAELLDADDAEVLDALPDNNQL